MIVQPDLSRSWSETPKTGFLASQLTLRLSRYLFCTMILRIPNPHVTNGLSHPYHLDQSTFILGALGVIFHFFTLFDEIHVHVSKQNSPRWDAASYLGLLCLPMSHKKDVRLIWVSYGVMACNLFYFVVIFLFSFVFDLFFYVHGKQLRLYLYG